METLAACTRPTQVQSIKCSRSQKGIQLLNKIQLLTKKLSAVLTCWQEKKSVSPNVVSLSVSTTLPGMPQIRSSWPTQNKHHSFWCEFCILFWYILSYLSFDCLFCFWPLCFYVVYLYWLFWKKRKTKKKSWVGGINRENWRRGRKMIKIWCIKN